MSDAKLILSTLIMGMKTLMYSITNYGNTAPNLAAPPGTPQLVSNCTPSHHHYLCHRAVLFVTWCHCGRDIVR